MVFLARKVFALFGLLALVLAVSACSMGGDGGNAKSRAPLSAEAKQRLTDIGSSSGEATMIRIFKESSELEVWKRTRSGQFALFKTYEICAWSGGLGPKFAEGDRQSPEGFYTITPGQMNPNSSYYLSFDTGFPNKFDRAHGRTGSDLMVHGDCSSRGCYSMTDGGIAEIYALVRDSFKGGNRGVQLQIFPFRLTPKNLARHADSPHMSFWNNLKTGYDYFEIAQRPVEWDVCGGEYVFDARSASGAPLDALAACPALIRDEGLFAQVRARSSGDHSAVQTAMADIEADKAKALVAEQQAAEAARREAELKAAGAARGQAINSAVTGFFGNMFGGGQSQPAGGQLDPAMVTGAPRS